MRRLLLKELGVAGWREMLGDGLEVEQEVAEVGEHLERNIARTASYFGQIPKFGFCQTRLCSTDLMRSDHSQEQLSSFEPGCVLSSDTVSQDPGKKWPP